MMHNVVIRKSARTVAHRDVIVYQTGAMTAEAECQDAKSATSGDDAGAHVCET